MTIRIDDRTVEQKITHSWLVTATDRFMSGWGPASGGNSKCAWACRDKDVDVVFDWVKARDEMRYVNATNNPWYPRNAKHVHIYVVTDDHPALSSH